MNLADMDLDAQSAAIATDEKEAVIAILDNPTTWWILHQLCGGPLRSIRNRLEASDENEAGKIGRMRGQIQAYKALPVLAENLKKRLETEIEKSREEAQRNA